MKLETYFDKTTSTLTYIIHDGSDAVVIDTVLNYEPHGSTISFESVNLVDDFIKKNKLNLQYILETHAHADHLSGSQELKKRYPKALVAISKNIIKVQTTFKDVYNLEYLQTDGSQFDKLFEDQEQINAGTLNFKVLFTPGHTPACASYYFNQQWVFTGDALFMEDYGTGRCDFPDGSAKDLYNSITKKLYTLPNETKVYPGHDYPGSAGRELAFESSIAIEKESNKQLKANTTQEEYIEFRQSRDATLKAPRLIYQSIQVNIEAGHLPKKESNQTSYLKIPMTTKES